MDAIEQSKGYMMQGRHHILGANKKEDKLIVN
jgi:hypothetical protein